MNIESIENAFTYHPPNDAEQVSKYQDIREFAKTFAYFLVDAVPAGPELNASITRLQELVFWANAGIARGE